MLRAKGIDYRRIDLVAVVHRGVLRALGFPGITVPGAAAGGQARAGHARDRRGARRAAARPAAVPGRPRGGRAAEAWGDEVYQPVPRRLVWAALRRDRSTLPTYLAGAKLGVPVPVAAAPRRAGRPRGRARQPRHRRERAARPRAAARAARPRRRAAALRHHRRDDPERRRLPDRHLHGAARDARGRRARRSRGGRRWRTRGASRRAIPGTSRRSSRRTGCKPDRRSVGTRPYGGWLDGSGYSPQTASRKDDRATG